MAEQNLHRGDPIYAIVGQDIGDPNEQKKAILAHCIAHDGNQYAAFKVIGEPFAGGYITGSVQVMGVDEKGIPVPGDADDDRRMWVHGSPDDEGRVWVFPDEVPQGYPVG